jgi:hypothetical protein
MIDWYSCWFLVIFSGFWVIYLYYWWLNFVQFVLVSFAQVQHLLQYQRQKGSGPTGPMEELCTILPGAPLGDVRAWWTWYFVWSFFGMTWIVFLPHNRLADIVMDRRENWWHNSSVETRSTAAQVKEGSDPATFIELMKSGPSGWQGPRGPRVPRSQDVPGVAIFGPFSMAWFKWKSTGNYGFANQRWRVSSISFPSSPELNLGCSVNTRDTQFIIGLVSP